MTEHSPTELGRIAYEAYHTASRIQPPSWEELETRDRQRWIRGAAAVADPGRSFLEAFYGNPAPFGRDWRDQEPAFREKIIRAAEAVRRAGL